MASDQFSRTVSSDAIKPINTSRTVTPLAPIVGKKVERKKSAVEEHETTAQHQHYSELKPPDPELWDVVIEAVERFNEHQDIRRSPFGIRIWSQNDGFRIQLIQEETGQLIKQSKLIFFKKITTKDLNHIINSLIRERGVVIDLVR